VEDKAAPVLAGGRVMRFGSVCSGIEAASVAWEPLGWQPVFFSEIEKFPCQVLKHHYPQVPNFGDLTQFEKWPHARIDLLVGGTPCQSFSVAGQRKGMDDPRGNLSLVYAGVAARYRPRWVVWENVPGVLSSGGGRDFGSFLGSLGKLGYGLAYRVLDAQHFGVPQRRRRVFVVGYLGDWRRAAAVFFEQPGLRGDFAEVRDEKAPVARSVTAGSGRRYDADTDDFVVSVNPQIARTLTSGGSTPASRGKRSGSNQENLVVHTLRSSGHDASEDGSGRGTPLVVCNGQSSYREADLAPPLRSSGADCGGGNEVIAFHTQQDPVSGPVAPSVGVGGRGQSTVATLQASSKRAGYRVGAEEAATGFCQLTDGLPRRLVPAECERLQGFSGSYTAIPGSSDSQRYRAIGNSMAVPCMSWIGRRIAFVDSLLIGGEPV
jgi:DNA (cytosine-5)-methyltransferase 1